MPPKRIIIIACLIALRVITLYYPVPHHAPLMCALADESQKKENWSKAIRYYKKAVFHNPLFPQGYFGLGLIYEKMGDPKKKIETFQKIDISVANDPNCLQAYYEAGLGYLHNENYQDAIRFFRRIIFINKGFYQAFYYLGIANMAIGNKASAAENLRTFNNNFSDTNPEVVKMRADLSNILKTPVNNN